MITFFIKPLRTKMLEVIGFNSHQNSPLTVNSGFRKICQIKKTRQMCISIKINYLFLIDNCIICEEIKLIEQLLHIDLDRLPNRILICVFIVLKIFFFLYFLKSPKVPVSTLAHTASTMIDAPHRARVFALLAPVRPFHAFSAQHRHRL